MKRILKPILLSMFILLATSIGFFMAFMPIERNTSQAVISGVSGEEIYLTSKFGTTPTNAFVDENNESTLVNASVSDKGEFYINREGQEVKEYFAIQGKSGASSKYSYGYAQFKMTEEMNAFAKKGILYVQANAGIITKAERANSDVEIKISQEDKESRVKSNYITGGINNVQWIDTEFIQVIPDTLITFNFSSADRGTILNPCSFSIIEPKLVFKTIINSVEITETTQKVSAGQVVRLSGSNDVIAFTGQSDYLKYYRALHSIQYEIVEGAELGKIIDGYLYVDENATEGVIKIKAKSRKDSITGGWIYSENKEYTITNEKISVKISSNFENPATFYGEGDFLLGKKTTLIANPNDRFTFDYWLIDGVKHTNKKFVYTVIENPDIQCFFKKDVFVSKVNALEKVYDGTTNVFCEIELDGIEEGHRVELTGLTVSYETANAGEDKKIIYGGSPRLIGEDAKYYKLVDLDKIPEARGKVIKKDVIITTNDAEKIYGSLDDVLIFESSVANIQGRLSREAGEDVGRYLINIGNLNELNPNYNCFIAENKYYTIVKRDIKINEIKIETKTYDGTKNAIVEKCEVSNTVEGDDINVDLAVEFTDVNVGERELKILSSALVGTKKDNYNLILDDTVFKARIIPKDVVVVAKEKESIFGDPIELEYECEGLLDGERFEGSLEIDSNEVGTYIIKNKLSNLNYNIKYTSANYTIKQREIKISAINVNKTYGDNDPLFEYTVENILDSEPLDGTLVRESGEDVGEYNIEIGSLNNSNYKIVEFNGAKLTINKKEINLNIQIENKTYDGTKTANFSYYFSGIVGDDSLEYNATMEFESCDVGEGIPVIVNTSYFLGDKLKNYEIISAVGDLKGKILRKDVFITPHDKQIVYGDEEVQLDYDIEGILEDESLFGTLLREEGRDAGEYEIFLNDITNENNKNYNIISKKQAYYTILEADISVKALKLEKIYGNSDPEFTYEIVDPSQLKYNDSADGLFVGELSREEGEVPGRYAIKIGTLGCVKNYVIKNFVEDYLIIQKRDIRVEVNNSEKIYGDEDPEFT